MSYISFIRTYRCRWLAALLYPVDQKPAGMAMRFQQAMPVSPWMKLKRDTMDSNWSTLLLKGRRHCKKSVVVLLSGRRRTSTFHTWCKILNRLRVHPTGTAGTGMMTPTHLINLRRRTSRLPRHASRLPRHVSRLPRRLRRLSPPK